jgi:tetratricopeptide (TPR) repeat protein
MSVINCRGEVYYHLGRHEEALIDLTNAIALRSDDVSAYSLRALNFFYLKRYEEALSDLTQVIKLAPKRTSEIMLRGITYYHLEHYENALADIDQAISVDPDNQSAILFRKIIYRLIIQGSNLVSGLTRMPNLKEAVRIAEQDSRLHPGNIRLVFVLALYYLANQQFDLSRKAYQNGLNYGATHSQISEAMQDLKEFLKLFPRHPQASTFYNGLRNKVRVSSVKLDSKED